jgi:hypothetical protein
MDDVPQAPGDRPIAPNDTGVLVDSPGVADTGPTRCMNAMDCDDGISCTDDSCSMDGLCAHAPVNARCDDQRFCTGTETCNPATGCVSGTTPSCDDMNDTTTDRCDLGIDRCLNAPIDADGDGDPPVSAGGHDCDDNDPTVSSLAREVCNMRDDNCNGMVDEGALNLCGNCDPSCRAASSGAMGMPFNPMGQRGVELDPMAGGLLVRAENRTADYLWIPNVAESTLSKWDAMTGRELGRYRVGLPAGECRGQCCHAQGCNMPSRTVVDGFGDAYVANRAFGFQGSVTKVAADRRDCVDRNGNGMIDTSGGAADVRPYGQDECIVWTANVGTVNAVLRAITTDRGDAMAPQGNVWVGTCDQANPARVWKLNPQTGAVIFQATSPNPAYNCFYGAVGLADGTVWFNNAHSGGNNAVVPMDSTTNRWGTPISTAHPNCTNVYGIAADARGRLWLSSPYCNNVVGVDPSQANPAQRLTWVPAAGVTGLGVTIDSMGFVWTHRWTNGSELIRFPSDIFAPGAIANAAMVQRIPTGRSFGATSAIGADRIGNIWFTSYDNPSTLVRYVPGAGGGPGGVFTNFSGPNQPYTYTDFTGSVRRTVIGTGTYTEDYDTGCANPSVAQLTWDAVTPAGTSLIFSVRTADTVAGLGGATATTVANAPMMMPPVDVGARLAAQMPAIVARRQLRLTVTFNSSSMPIASPVLRSMSLAWRCPYVVPGA